MEEDVNGKAYRHLDCASDVPAVRPLKRRKEPLHSTCEAPRDAPGLRSLMGEPVKGSLHPEYGFTLWLQQLFGKE